METKKHKTTVHINENGEVSLSDILAGTDIDPSTVEYYSLSQEKKGALLLVLYDKNKKQIKVERESIS